MTTPEFKVGDRVTWELSSGSVPRWDWNADKGGGGKWGEGTVKCVENNTIRVKPDSGHEWIWLDHGHPAFKPDQWDRPGFLRHIGEQTKMKMVLRLIDMGSHYISKMVEVDIEPPQD